MGTRKWQHSLIFCCHTINESSIHHFDVMTWKRFTRYWPIVSGIQRSSADFPKMIRTLIFFVGLRQTTCWTNSLVNSGWRCHYACAILCNVATADITKDQNHRIRRRELWYILNDSEINVILRCQFFHPKKFNLKNTVMCLVTSD